MDQISFRRPVANGSILRFNIQPIKRGKTSVQYTVDVFTDSPGSSTETDVFSTTITFAQVDGDGNKSPLPKKDKLRSEEELLGTGVRGCGCYLQAWDSPHAGTVPVVSIKNQSTTSISTKHHPISGIAALISLSSSLIALAAAPTAIS
jgi:acyl-CoA hydrolase